MAENSSIEWTDASWTPIRARIERTTKAHSGGLQIAHFIVHEPQRHGGPWEACAAMVLSDGTQEVASTGFHCTQEQTAAVILALQMAVAWVGEVAGGAQ